jgi:hypothetical protein
MRAGLCVAAAIVLLGAAPVAAGAVRDGPILLGVNVNQQGPLCRPSAAVACSPDDPHFGMLYQLWSLEPSTGSVLKRIDCACVDVSPAPDGRHLAWVAFDGRLMVSDLRGRNARALAKEAADPAWMPNGRTIVFISGTRVRSVAARGGRPKTLLGSRARRAPKAVVVSSRGTIAVLRLAPAKAQPFLCANDRTQLDRVQEDGRATLMYRLPDPCGAVVDPAWSPDGRYLVVRDASGSGDENVPTPPAVVARRGLGIFEPHTRTYRVLGFDGGYAAWSPTGRQIVYRGTCGGGDDLICLTTPTGGTARFLATAGPGGYQSLAWLAG